MRRLLLAACLALCAGNLAALDKGEEAPNFTFEASWNVLDGSKQLTDYRGKIVFLEIWKIH